MAAISLRALTRRYDGAHTAALHALDLDVNDGEVVVLVGPSGCGKSTTLRLIAGLDSPDGGAIRIGDRDVKEVAPQDRDVAMVFQGYALYPHLTVREIISFPLKMRGIPKAERSRKAEEAAGLLGLGRLLDRRPGELSGGERQRVAMGRAIVRSPKVFLFDEPLSNLDAALRAELRVELASLVRRFGTTSLYVTHDQTEAMTLGDRIAVLDQGRLQQLGTPRHIYQDPENVFVAKFLGTPPINLFELTLEDGVAEGKGVRLPVPALDAATGRALTRGSRVIAAVRPEHVRIDARSADAGANDDRIRVPANIVTSEPLGAETYVYGESEGQSIRARLPGFETPGRGDSVDFLLHGRDVLWFDADSGLRIRPAAAKATA